MDKIKTSKDVDFRRRHFVGTAALTVAAAQLGMIGVVDAQSGKAKLPSVKPGSHTSFGPLKQIDAGLLNVGYAEAGPAMVLQSFFCTVGPTTFTALSMSRRCWRRPAIG